MAHPDLSAVSMLPRELSPSSQQLQQRRRVCRQHAGKLRGGSFLYHQLSTSQSSGQQNLREGRQVILCASPTRPTKHVAALLSQFGLNKVSGGSKMTDSGLGNTVFPIHLKNFPLQGLSEALTTLTT